MATAPRRVTGDVTRWKAMSHPLRREILRHLGTHDAATSTTIERGRIGTDHPDIMHGCTK